MNRTLKQVYLDHYETKLIKKRDEAMTALVARSPDQATGLIEFLGHVHDLAEHLRGPQTTQDVSINKQLEHYVAWHVLSFGSTHDCRERGTLTSCDVKGHVIGTFYDRVIAGQKPYFDPHEADAINDAVVQSVRPKRTVTSVIIPASAIKSVPAPI